MHEEKYAAGPGHQETPAGWLCLKLIIRPRAPDKKGGRAVSLDAAPFGAPWPGGAWLEDLEY